MNYSGRHSSLSMRSMEALPNEASLDANAPLVQLRGGHAATPPHSAHQHQQHQGYQAALPGNRHSYTAPGSHGGFGDSFTEHSLRRLSYNPHQLNGSFQLRRQPLAHQRSLDEASSVSLASQNGQCYLPGRHCFLGGSNFSCLSSVQEGEHEMAATRGKYDFVDQGPEMSDGGGSPRSGGESVIGEKGGGGGEGGGAGKYDHQHAHQQHHHATPPQPQPVLAPGLPMPGQVLVDPTTGQHYIIPSPAPTGMMPPSTQPTPLYYQPMYYPTAAAATGPTASGPPQAGQGGPHQPQPVYFPAFPAHIMGQGYAMPTPLTAFQSRYAMPGYGQAAMGGGGGSPRQPHPGFQHHTSSTDDLTRRPSETYNDDHPPPSPHFGRVTTFAANYQAQQQQPPPPQRPSPPSSQPEDPENSRDPFRRDLTRLSGGAQPEIPRFTPQGLPQAPGMPTGVEQLQQQQPLWWPRMRRPINLSDQESLSDIESASRQQQHPQQTRPSPPPLSTFSDSESTGRFAFMPMQQQHQQPPQHHPPPTQQKTPEPQPPRPPPKAVRMDIDLNKPIIGLDEEAEEKPKQKPSNRAPPTAFTVTFDNDSTSAPAISLQDAARKSGNGRRFTQRAALGAGGRPGGPAKAEATPTRPRTSAAAMAATTTTTPDDKSFLLDKLLHGYGARPATAAASAASSSAFQSAGGPTARHAPPQSMSRAPSSVRDTDNLSDAGTYIVEETDATKTARSAMITSQIVERDSDSSSTASSSRSASPTPAATATTSTSAMKSPVMDDNKRALLQRLMELKASTPASDPAATSPRSGASGSSSGGGLPSPKARQSLMTSSTNRSVFGQAATSAGLMSARPATASSTASSNHHHNPGTPAMPSTSATSTTANNAFRRGDGGRFSMRSAAGGGGVAQPPGGASPQHAPKQQRPPFKVGGARPVPSSVAAAAQREHEMTAWLRRKDYNPMRAAAEAKKAAQLKARGDQFTSNRSISFHVGPAAGPVKKLGFPGSELSRNKSSESLTAGEGGATDAAASHASQRVIAEYSRGVVDDISKLTKQHSRTKNQKEMSGLAKAVDILSNKCKKSIELIRAQNKGCLSVSVEDLLSTAVEPPKDDESLTDQLDRLSQAFDAVQRYLEQYSLEEKDFSDDDDDEDSYMGGGAGRRGGSARTALGGGGGGGSMVSAFERRSGRASGGGVASSRAASMAMGPSSAASRPQRTTAYRARVLAQNRSPSSGRPAKNN